MSKRAFVGVLLFTACGSDSEGASPSDKERSVQVAERCSTLSLQDCSGDPECATLAAMAVDTDHQCLQPAVPVVCTKKYLGCDAALTLVEVAGKRYRLGGGCHTPGVEIVEAAFIQGTPESKQLAWGPCGAQLAPPACAAGTTMLSPGCGASKHWEKGCYASCNAVGDDTNCAAGYSCQETWVQPCASTTDGSASCDACGELTLLCLAAPAGT